jgi:hypothetical protein
MTIRVYILVVRRKYRPDSHLSTTYLQRLALGILHSLRATDWNGAIAPSIDFHQGMSHLIHEQDPVQDLRRVQERVTAKLRSCAADIQ